MCLSLLERKTNIPRTARIKILIPNINPVVAIDTSKPTNNNISQFTHFSRKYLLLSVIYKTIPAEKAELCVDCCLYVIWHVCRSYSTANFELKENIQKYFNQGIFNRPKNL